jgi:uracil phosphoribosyltransferase
LAEKVSHSEAAKLTNLAVSQHPLVMDKIAQLANAETPSGTFRDLLRDLTRLLLYEATTDLPTREVAFRTPLEETRGHRLDARIALVPIMRAGLGMLEGARDLLPDATIYHLGIYRDETTHHPISYYDKLPFPMPIDIAMVLDPMLATAGSASAAVTELKRHGVKTVTFVGLIAAPEGVQLMFDEHPDVRLHVALLDRELDENKFIRPGLGDAGDRLFGT